MICGAVEVTFADVRHFVSVLYKPDIRVPLYLRIEMKRTVFSSVRGLNGMRFPLCLFSGLVRTTGKVP